VATKSNRLLGFVLKGLKIVNLGFVLIGARLCDATLLMHLILGAYLKGVTMNNQDLTLLSRSVGAASFGVCLTVDGEDYLIWTVRERNLISERLPIFCTPTERLKAHLVGFCSNVGK
jgi:hypothetical protein